MFTRACHGPNSQKNVSNPRPPIPFIERYITILTCHLWLGRASGHVPSGFFRPKIWMHNPFSPTCATCPTSTILLNLITGTLQKFYLVLRLNRKSTPPSYFRLKSTHAYLSDTSFADNAALLNKTKKTWTFLFWKDCHSAFFSGTACLYGWIRGIFKKLPHFLSQDMFSLSFGHHKWAWTRSYLPTAFLDCELQTQYRRFSHIL